jgi:hypothetical protein
MGDSLARLASYVTPRRPHDCARSAAQPKPARSPACQRSAAIDQFMKHTDHIPSVGRYEPAQGRQKEQGQTLRFSAVPDGVRPAEPQDAAPQSACTGAPFDSESGRQAARKRWELAKVPDFARQELEFTPTEDFKPFDAGRRELLMAKAGELVAMTGGDVGAGVLTVVRGYSWLISFAEFYSVRAAKTGSDDDADRARRFFKDASIELAKAHELARAEAPAARKKSRRVPSYLTDGDDSK